VRLTVIGCAGSFPSPSSAASCYLVEHDGARLVLDLGNGALGPLAGAVDLREIDAVLLTHLHADHCLDLTGMYVARRYHPSGPLPALPVHGPVGTAERIADAYRASASDPVAGLGRALQFIDHAARVRIGPFTVTLAQVVHPVPAVALRVEAAGRALVYSGDTGPCPALVELSRGADLALFEASFLSDPGNPVDLHLTAAEAGQHAAAAGVGRLLLTHLVAWNDPAASLAEGRSTFDGELALAAPGMVVQI
jgi:ribonuclease BN (tRNA processing enzyme)